LNNLPDQLKAILTESETRTAMANRIVQAIRSSGDYRWVGLYDVKFEVGLVSNIAWSGPSAPAYPDFPITKGLTSRAITERRTVNVGDVADDPNYLTALDSTRSEIIVPVLDDARNVVGTIDIESAELNAFDHSAESLLEDCAGVLKAFWTITSQPGED
jgi:putative methionine-R-sulfoxide reductase with GAF domain